MHSDSAIQRIARIVADELSPSIQEKVLGAIRQELRDLTRSRESASAGERLLTVEEAAAFCNVTPPTVREWIRQGHLPALLPGGGRSYRIRRTDLDAFLARPAASRGAPRSVDEQVNEILMNVRSKAP
jgi:excisionase family DNA binding protein